MRNGQAKQYLSYFVQRFPKDFILKQLDQVRDKKILVIGDAVVDEYHYTRPLGKSSKEPLVVHQYVRQETFAGGTLATANHIASFCNHVKLVTVLGNQESRASFIRKHMQPVVGIKFFYQDGTSTIVKRRYVDEYTNQKLFAISFLTEREIGSVVEGKIIAYLKNEIPKHDAIVVNDFGHGMLTKKLIRLICAKAKRLALNVQANSANYGFNVVTKYSRADFVCIDDMELRLATHDKFSSLEVLLKKISNKLKCQHIIATRGPFGSTSYAKKLGFINVPAFTQTIVDRVGAGDAFFAIASACWAANIDRELLGFISNVAAAVKLQIVGNKKPVEYEALVKFINKLLK